jgi:hypothetical protein
MFIVNDGDTENPAIPSFLETGCTANIYSGNWGPSKKLLKSPEIRKSVNFWVIKVKIKIVRL